MKATLMIPFLVMLASSAYADYGSITCNTSTPVNLEFAEMSDISKETLRMSIAGQKVEFNEFNASNNDYGLLSITIDAGTPQQVRKFVFDKVAAIFF